VNGSGGNVAGCATCAGRCCREYRVQVTARDVCTLAADTALPPADFVRLEECEADKPGFRLRPGGPPHALQLIRHAATGACVFLMEIAPDLARCGVYTARPMVCRNFPTTLRLGAVAVRDEVKCGPGSWNLAAMDVTTYRRDLVQADAGWKEHWTLVNAWNQAIDAESRQASPADLYDFLLGQVPGVQRPPG
jgi:Fe-S-cluster containining protein